ncbi:MAG TPA: NAD(P)-dependent oxidoreductase [Anaerolineales bacterium]|nr:NAD(P)-dependent oxidoreductase [Anaerolineales bacterium]
MKIAVTGSSGRVGKAIVELALAQGHGLVCIDRVAPQKNVEDPDSASAYIQADLTDYAAFEAALRGCDALVHMAAIPAPIGHPDHIVHNNNVVSSYNALRAAVAVGIQRVCQASSVNATGLGYSRWPRFDYFPLDEKHPTYNEDPYSLSKWICEEQGNSFARRYENLVISSMRFHAVLRDRPAAVNAKGYSQTDAAVRNLWGYTRFDAAARACLLALTANFTGHEVFYIVAPDTISDTPSLELQQKHFPDVPVRGDLSGHKSFFDSSKAERLLGWKHNE